MRCIELSNYVHQLLESARARSKLLLSYGSDISPSPEVPFCQAAVHHIGAYLRWVQSFYKAEHYGMHQDFTEDKGLTVYRWIHCAFMGNEDRIFAGRLSTR